MSHSLVSAALGEFPKVSTGTVAIALVGLALYQLTSLELGPRAHDFQINLAPDGPLVQEVILPLEKADGMVGQISVALRFAPPSVVTSDFRSVPAQGNVASVVMATGTTPGAATKQLPLPAAGAAPVSTTKQSGPLPIIGRCRDRLIGLLSAMSPSSGSDREVTGSPCSGAAGPD